MRPLPVVLLLGAIFVTSLSYVGWQKVGQIAYLLEQELEHMDPLVTTWTDAEGLTHTVTTHRDGTETMAQWVDRHKEKVDAMKAAFPPAT